MNPLGHSLASICKKKQHVLLPQKGLVSTVAQCTRNFPQILRNHGLPHYIHLHLQYCYESSNSLLMLTCNPPYLSQALERGIHQQACGGGVAMATSNTELNRSINTRQHPPGQER